MGAGNVSSQLNAQRMGAPEKSPRPVVPAFDLVYHGLGGWACVAGWNVPSGLMDGWGNGMVRNTFGRFVNMDGTTPHSYTDIAKWGVLEAVTMRTRRRHSRMPVSVITPDMDLLRDVPGPCDGARLTWLGHSSWLVQLDGVSLLIDPVLSDRVAAGIRRRAPPALRVDQLPPVDLQLVTHNHYDHLDARTLAAVGSPAVAGVGVGELLSRIGLSCTELDWWEHIDLGDVRITFVPAQHWSRRGLLDGNRTLWGGFVIEGSSSRVYHAGDTAWFDRFKEIGRRFPGIDAAMLPIGAYSPGWFMERHHLNPEQAVAAYLDLEAGLFLPMHWGAFKLSHEPLDEPPVRVRREWGRRGLDEARLGLIPVGETVWVGLGT